MTTFVALIHKDPGSDYGVSFPDFPGCISAGRDVTEAMAMAEEALGAHVELMIESGQEIPQPTEPTVVQGRRAARGAILALVSVTPRRRRSVRIDVTMNERLVRRIDRVAEERGQTRSGFLEGAARAALTPR